MTESHDAACTPVGEARLRSMVGRSAAFHELDRQIERIAGAVAPVLLEGETGCGKEMAARAIHYRGARRDRPFVPINCGAVADNLLESELFGHVRGAFTDAKTAHVGLVAQADRGTLFLDEVDALSPRAQVALLRFLQDQRYRRIGDTVEQTCDTRVLAASNRCLESLVATGQFRVDLLYRLNIVVLRIPPLRERREDIEPLARHFVERYCRQYGLEPRPLHAETRRWMLTHGWPGNIRELENTVHRLVLMSDAEELCDARAATQTRATDGADFHSAKQRAIETFERAYLTRMLAQTRGNVSEAARLAQKDRRALGRLIKKHGIDAAGYRA